MCSKIVVLVICDIMTFESLSHYEKFTQIPYFVVYEVYIALKVYTIVLVIYSSIFHKRRLKVSSVLHMLFVALLCFLSCFCCCCFQEKGSAIISSIVQKTDVIYAKFSHFCVNMLFGPKVGIVDRADNYKKGIKNEKGISKLFIRNKKLSDTEVSHLSLLIIVFCLLASITAWDVYFLEETYVCSDDPSIKCFPVADDDTANNTDLNLTDAQQHSTTDCSFWNSENVSSRVSIKCFRWIYNSKAVASSVGGLLTIFLLSVRVILAVLIAICEVIIEKFLSTEEIGDGAEKVSRVTRFICRLRIGISVFATLIELAIGIGLIFVHIQDKGDYTNKFIRLFYSHGNQFLLAAAIVSIILLLPVEEYAARGYIDESYIEIPNIIDNMHVPVCEDVSKEIC